MKFGGDSDLRTLFVTEISQEVNNEMIVGTIKVLLAATCGVIIGKKLLIPFIDYLAEMIDDLVH